MNRLSVMFIAGEPSGDILASELVVALREEILRRGRKPSPDVQPLRTALSPTFFGAGGPNMAAAGVDLAFDLTKHSVTGISEVMGNYFKFRRLFNQLLELAVARQPDVIVCVDFSGFNRRFASAVKAHVRALAGEFNNWNPRIVQYVSPQVWASRPGRALAISRAYDLLLTIFPFEKAWYAERLPGFRVEYVGHPMMERHANVERGTRNAESASPEIVLLPGSRVGELKRHVPVMFDALRAVQAAQPRVRSRMILPDEAMADLAQTVTLPFFPPPGLEFQAGGLAQALRSATVAIASTGTVTLECAYFGVPTVALYKTSWITYQIGRRLVRVKFLAMPNLLADEEVYPEFIQDAATAQNLTQATLALLNDEARRRAIQQKLATIVASLGGPGAAARAAQAVASLLDLR